MANELDFNNFKIIMQNIKEFEENLIIIKNIGIDLDKIVENLYWAIETYEEIVFESTDIEWLYDNYIFGDCSIEEAWEHIINGCINIIDPEDIINE